MKKTKVLLITVVMIAVLVLATMLTVGAATPNTGYENDAAAMTADSSFVARVGEEGTSAVYYADLKSAIYSVAEADTTVYLLKSYTQTSSLKSVKNDSANGGVAVNYTLEAISDDVVLTVDTSYLFDLGGGSNVVPTLKNIKINVGSKNLGYFNTVTINIGEGTHIYGAGTSNGLIYSYNAAKINVSEGAVIEPTGTNPAFKMDNNNGVLTINGGTFNGGAFVTAVGTNKVVVNGGTFNLTSGSGVRGFYMSGASTVFEMNGGKIVATNAASSNVIRADGKFTVTGGEIVVDAAGNNPVRLSGVATISGGAFRNNSGQGFFYVPETGKLTVTGGTFKTTHAEMVRTGEKAEHSPVVNIEDGLFIIENTRAKDNGGNMNLLKIDYGSLNISGGTFAVLAASNNPVRIASGKNTVTGGTFINKTGQAFIYTLGNTEISVDGVTYDGTNGLFVYAGDGTSNTVTKVYINDSTITGNCTCQSNAKIYLLGTTSYPTAQGAGVFVTQGIIDAERVATIGEPTEEIIDHPTFGKVQVFNHYYTSVGGAVSAMSGSNNTVILLKDFTQTTSLPKNTKVSSYTLTAQNGAVLTIGCDWLFDLGANSTVVPTIKNIEIVVPKGKGLGYFNGVKLIIDEGAYIHGAGKSASNGLITGVANATIIVKDGAKIVAENTDFPIAAMKEGSYMDIQGGTFIHTGTYSGKDEYAMFRLYNKPSKIKVSGNTTMVMDIKAPNANGFMFWRGEGGLWVEGENVALIARNNNYLFEQGYQNTEAFGIDKLYVRGAYLYTDRADGVLVLRDAQAKYVDVVKVAIDNDAAAMKYNCNGVAYSTRLSDSSNTRTVVIPATLNSPEVTKSVIKAYCPDVSVTCSMVEPGSVIYLFTDYTVTSTIQVSQDVTFSAEMKPDGTRYKIITKKSPAFKVTYGTLTFENIDIECNSLLAQTYGTVVLGEGVNINVNANDRFLYVNEGGAVVVDGADIDVVYTSNNTIRCDNGTVIFNSGSMTVHNAGNDVIRIRGDFVMNGGTIENYVTRNTFYLTAENNTASTITVNGGTIISNNYNMVYADGGVATFNGGTIVQHAAAIVQIVGTAHVNVHGGVFVADRASSEAANTTLSMYLFYKGTATSSATVTGGIYLLYDRDYIYYSAVAGEEQPNVAFLKNENNFIAFGDGEYYFMAFNDQLNAAPVLNGTVSLNEQTYGMVFTSTVSAANRAAIEAWAASVAGEGVAYTLTYGTLIAPTTNVLAAGDFSKAAFDACGLAYLNVVAANVPAEGAFTFAAEKNGFTENEYGVLYTAVPYVIVTVDGVDTVLYGSYQTDVSASISYLATRLLSDVTDIKTGAYQYASIAVEAAYSRFTVEAQRALKALMAHVHTNDYKGVCSACQNDSAIDLAVDTTTKMFMKYENEYNYRLVLKNGVVYSFELSKAIADLTLYDATGKACAIVNGQFACKADGVYYLKASAALVGDAVLSVSHVHERDFTGYCTVCETNFLNEIATETTSSEMFKKDETYYYAVELVAGMKYQILTVNGQYVVYNAEGVAMPIANSTFSCEEDGVYYVVVVASVSAKGSMIAKHIHDFDDNGDCKLDTCNHSVSVAFADVYDKKTVSFENGKNSYFNIELAANNKYFLVTEGNLGVWTIYAPSGELVELGAKGDFVAEEDGEYRFVLAAQITVSGQIWFEIEHTCDYGYTGICSICSVGAKDRVLTLTDGKLQRKTLKKDLPYYYSVSGMVDGATYTLSIPAGVNMAAYNENGDELAFVDGKIVWDAEDGSVLYLVLSTAEEVDSGELKIAHEHEIDFKGACGIAGCSTNKKSYATVDSSVKAQYKNGETYYYVVEWPEAGNTYKVVLDKAVGDVVIYKPNGDVVELAADGSFVGEKMCYYIVVTATADAETGATLTFATVK